MDSNNKPLVSVFILCYNHEHYISEAIESVSNQSYQNIEIIIVDNYSKDNSKVIIEKYLKKDSRIQFYPMSYNTLPSYGSNYAINKCRGQYICALSADDYFMPNKIEEHLGFMIKNNLDLSFTWINTISSSSKRIADNLIEKWFNRIDILEYHDIVKQYVLNQNITNAITVMVKKSLLEAESHIYDNRLLQTQDFDLWIRLLAKTNKVKILPKPLTQYRILENDGNLSLGNSPLKKNRTAFEHIHIFKRFTEYPSVTLSKILSKNITDDNKLESIYNFFKDNKNYYGQFATLLHAFERLGEDCDIQSNIFNFFFENYGDISISSDTSIIESSNDNIWLKSEIGNYQKVLNEKNEGIQWLKSEIGNYQKVLNEKNEGIQWLKSEIGNYQKVLNEKNEGIQWLQSELEGYKELLNDKDEEIMRLTTILQNESHT